MEPDTHDQLPPPVLDGLSPTRRRFLLFAALAALAACAPVVTTEHVPSEPPGMTTATLVASAVPPRVPQQAAIPVEGGPPAGTAGDESTRGLDATQTSAQPPLPPDDGLPSGPQPPHAPATQLPVPSMLLTHGDRSHSLVALTFDACETPNNRAGYDERVIQILSHAHAPATLFLCGHWVATHSEHTRALAANPLFELGNHSWGHPDFTKINPVTMDLELGRTQAIIYQLTGRQPTLFRMPYGNWSPTALAEVSRSGLHTIQWDVVTGDPDPHVSAKMIVTTVKRQARNGSIIVMHMNGRGVHTAEALTTLIYNLRSQGYILATVSQTLGLVPFTV